MKTDERYILQLNYDEAHLTESFKKVQPTVYRDGHAYCCISGGNPVDGIFGCGNSPEEAIENWDKAFEKRKGG